ncbi:hypothetical protein [Notoacmeibacter ruber]|uniref:Excinuclease ABC subunit B n=1 Tax=Notoacmeibacter ruber TaxID=2670375 RepID=A0A3L7JF33_9HYPH|nr:hypothetical protein [Notoacmeibacter ruber]RLQ89263.1 hypothetical protein D8780_14445 [Notoacmeibacter ruber]
MNQYAAIATVMLVAMATPAAATGEIVCRGVESDAIRVTLGFGTLPVLSVISARIETQEATYQLSEGGNADLIRFGDGAFLNDGLIARFTDDIVNEILAELRIVNMDDGRHFASVGLLRLPGKAAHALVCEGP